MLIIVRYTNTLTDLLTYKQTDKQTAVKTASPPKVVKAIDNMCTVC